MRMKLYTIVVLLSFMLTFTAARTITLDQGWTLRNSTFSLDDVQIPSGVYTELEKRGLTKPVLFSRNDVNLRWIGEIDWSYELKFQTTKDMNNYTNIALTFHGLDTVADVVFNGEALGSTNNMFVRYTYDIKKLLKEEGDDNFLQVHFKSPISEALKLVNPADPIPPQCPPDRYNGVCHMNMLRKMQASFSWDWGPAVPSVGIWKPVVLELSNSAIVRDVLVNLKLLDEIWHLDVWISFEELTSNGLEQTRVQQAVKLGKGTDNDQHLYLQIHEDDVEKWWPNGLGKQTMYILHVRYEDCVSNDVRQPRSDWRSNHLLRVGFRTIELVEDTALNGSTFYFKVNGIPIFMKGSNFIPASIVPELSGDKATLKKLMHDAKDANMNMLRVWGGGLYESDYFYSLADELGILIWQDMMFACAMYPAGQEFLDSVRLETRQNVRRIQSHPSIAIWATNNENEAALRQNWYQTQGNFNKFADEYEKLYIDTVKDEIRKNDPWRVVLNSSPGNGQKFENTTIAQNPQDYHHGDVHFYTYDLNLWDPRIYPRARFVSEYGFQSFPSHGSWLDVMEPGDDLDKFIDHRQHFPFGSTPIEVLIEKNLPDLDRHAPDYIESLIYFSQVSQAMAVKIQTNSYRVESGRDASMQTMGALYWQLNDVWTAPSWSSVEFSGKYKILHNYITDIFQADVIVGLMNNLMNFDIFIINEHLQDKNYKVHVRVYKYATLDIVNEVVEAVNVTKNSVKLFKTEDIYEKLRTQGLDYREHIVQLLLNTEDGLTTLSTDFILLSTIREARKIQPPEISVIIVTNSCDPDSERATVSLSIETSKPALFVYLETLNNSKIIFPKFSTNGFHQFEAAKAVLLTYQNADCVYEVNSADLKVTTMNRFML